MKVKLERLANGGALRTSVVEGVADYLPEVGRRFSMYGESLDPTMDTRVVSTSLVKSVTICERYPTVYEVKTENSIYKLTVL